MVMTGGVVSGAENDAAATTAAAVNPSPEDEAFPLAVDEDEVRVDRAAAVAPQFPLTLQDRGAAPGQVCSAELLLVHGSTTVRERLMEAVCTEYGKWEREVRRLSVKSLKIKLEIIYLQ